MSIPLQSPTPDPLVVLRDRLDRVDLELHRLLRERFDIVAEIGRTKGPNESIVRPAREAAVVENRLAVHKGPLPPETLAHIWRVLIAAACEVQRRYTVHAVAPSLDAMRFLYGPVPATLHPTAAAAIAALAGRPDDLAVVPFAGEPWWQGRGEVHAIGLAAQSDGGRAVVLGGARVAPGTGATALVVQDDRLAEVRTADLAADADLVGRVHPFPLTIPVAQ